MQHPPSTSPNSLPTGGQVVAGNATINTSSNASSATMNINQTSQRAVVNWDSFNVGKNATVNFHQPNANAVMLNRVTGATASMIDGAVKANGQVIFVNPNGVTFGKGAEVNAAAVVASTLNIADKEFMDGKASFKDDGTGLGTKAGKITNKGSIQTTGEGGFIALLAPEVRNQGYLLAQKGGTVALGSGAHITLQIQGQSLVAVKVEESIYQGLISNKHIVEAPGGLVVLATGAANQLMAGVIKNTGKISANSLVNNGGVIELVAKTVTQAGTVFANSQTQQGGQVNIAAQEITLAKNSQTTATGATGGGQVNIGLANTQVSGGSQVNSQAPSAQTNTQAQAVIKANANAAANTKQLAKTVTIEQGATVDTSATHSGNGGTIAIWSELKTTVAGILKSTGGLLWGNGGFIETSSQGQVSLAPTANINTSANNQSGKAGTWLLDPIDLVIDSAAASLISQVLSNSNVTIAVTNSTSACPIGSCTQTNGNSSLTIASGADILKLGTAYTTLTLSSEGLFNLNANISGQNLDVVIQSSIAYLGVGTSINAAKVTVQAQTIYSSGTIQTSRYLASANPGSLNNAIELLAQAIYVSGRLSANASTGIAGNIKLEANTITLSANAQIEANGEQGGQVTIAANDSLWNSAVIQVNGGNGRGGTISLTAANDQSFTHAALLANGTTDGGAITITTARGDISFTDSLIQTNGSAGRGGSIGLSATNSTVIANSAIHANGYSQGGKILIGNDAANGSLPFSIYTSIDAQTQINAAQQDASQNNQAGGFIETSGQTLHLLASINAGRGGMWLLDPTDVIIDSVTASNIVTQLTAGTSVTIQTTGTTPTCTGSACVNTPSGLGDITVSSDIIVGSSSGVGSLTLTAYNNIAINANITLYGNLNLNAKVVNVALGATIHLNEGNGSGVNLLPATFNSSNWTGNGAYGTNGAYTAINAGPVGRVVYYSRAISGLVVGQSYTLKFSTYIPIGGSCGGVVANCAAVYFGALWVTGSNAYTSSTTPSTGVGITGSGPVGAGTGYTIISNMAAFTATDGVTSVSASAGNATQLSTSNNGVIVTANVVALSTTMTLEYVVRNDPSYTQVWNASLVSNSAPSKLTVNNSSTSTASSIQGVISGSTGTSLVKQGAGTLILDAVNTYDGGTTVDGGVLGVTNNSALGLGSLKLSADTSLLAAATSVSIGNNISLTGSASVITPADADLSLLGVVTDGGYGLVVSGQGALTLSNSANTITNLSSSGTAGALVIKNSSSMTLGSGVSELAANSMDIRTSTGSITIAGNLSATSSASDAIVIVAGNSLLRGSATTGSDILISGAPTISTGVGGRATLYTGTLAGSTGFSSSIIADGNYRYNSSISSNGFTAVLGSGVYLIYRERPMLTITANNVDMTYGATSLPSISVSISGLRNRDSSLTVTPGSGSSLAPIYDPSANTYTASPGATYSITPTGYSSTLGYGINNTSGILTMVAAPLTITAANDSKVYGSTTTTLHNVTYASGVAASVGSGYTVTGLVNGDTVSAVTLTSIGGNATSTVNGGPYLITPSALVGSGNVSSLNYVIHYVSAPIGLTITKANLAITATPSLTGNIYNGNTYTGTFTTNALGSDQAAMTITGVASGTNAGTYTSNLAATGSILSNYNTPVITNANLVISPKPIAISNNVSTSTYDGVTTYATLMANAGYTLSAPLVGADEISAVTQAASVMSSAVTGTAQAGHFISTPSAAVLSIGNANNYSFSYVPASNSVAKANLAITATPSLTGNIYNGNTYTGTFTTNALGSDQAAMTITGVASGTNAGTYTSNLAATGSILSNYNTPVITNANLVISRIPLVVKALSIKKQEGSVFSGGNGIALMGLLETESISSLSGVLTYSGSSQGASSAGAYEILPGGLTSQNYAITFVKGELILTPRPIVNVPIFTPPPALAVAPPPPVAAPPVAMVAAAPAPASAPAAHSGGGGEVAAPASAPPPVARAAAAPPAAAASGSAKAAPAAAASTSSSSKSSSSESGSSGKATTGSGKSSSSKSERVSKYEARKLAGAKDGSSKSEGKGSGSKGGAGGSKYAGKYANGARNADKATSAKAGTTKDGAPKASSVASSKPAAAREGKYNNLANAAANMPLIATPFNNQPQLTAVGLPPIVGMPVEIAPPPTVLRGGDSLTQSYDDVPSIRNSGVANVGRSRATENYHESLESVNLMSTLNLFILH